jgi:hypothetical protein
MSIKSSSGKMDSKKRQTSSDEIAIIENPGATATTHLEGGRNKTGFIDLSLPSLELKKSNTLVDVSVLNPSDTVLDKKPQTSRKNMPALRKRGVTALQK